MMLLYIIMILICIFEIYMAFDLYSAFLEVRQCIDTKLKSGLVIGVFGLVLYGINLLDNPLLNLVMGSMLYTILVLLFFNGNLSRKILLTAIWVLTIAGVEFVFTIILSTASGEILESSINNQFNYTLLTVVMKFMTFIVVSGYKQFAVKSTNKMDSHLFGYYLLIPLSSLGLMITSYYSGMALNDSSMGKIMLLIFCMLLFLGNILAFYGFTSHSEIMNQKMKDEKTMLVQKLQLDGYEKAELTNKKYARIIHDMNHHVATITALLQENKLKEIKELLVDLKKGYREIEMSDFGTNPILNAVLSDYKERAEECGIICEIHIEPCFNIEYVDKIDMVSMLGNLLSNAVEAAGQSLEKKIEVNMFMQNEGDFSVIKIENSFNGIVFQKNDKIVTSKNDKNNHGIGLESVESIAEKYHGYLETSWESRVFKSVLILQNSLREKERYFIR